MMLISGKCLHFTCTTLLRSNYSSHKLNPYIKSLCACERLLHLSLVRLNLQDNKKLQVLKVNEISTKSKSIFSRTVYFEQKRHIGFAAKFVNNSSPKIQPYMKLMRIDKPIGN